MSEQALQQHDEQPPAQTDQSGSLLAVIERSASDPNVDVDKLERLYQLYERHEARAAEAAFNASLSAAQSEMSRVSADATNPQTKSKYASYAALDKALRPVYSKHGFALSFDTADDAPDGFVKVVCQVSHAQGHSRSYHVNIPIETTGLQGKANMTRTHATASAMSYGMRYLLKLIFNVAVGEDDDDGNAAGTLERISDEQRAELEALMDEVGADRTRFCRYYKIPSVDQLPAQAYNDAISTLEAKRSRK